MPATLVDALISHAAAHAHGDAIVDGATTLSYGDLLEQSVAFGNELRARAAGGSRIVICLDNSPSYVIALYGCWFAGMTAVPVDSSARERELAKVCAHVEPALIVTSQRKRPAIAAADEVGCPWLDADAEMAAMTAGDGPASAGDGQFRRALENDVPALFISTSGTSGNPKCVVLSHGNLHANTTAIIDYLELTLDDRVFNVLPFHYSYGNSVLQTHLFAGGTVIVGGSMMYPQKALDALRESQATGFSGVPSTFALLLANTNWADDPPALRYVTQAGGAMSAKITMALRAALHARTKLYVMYGQTEATARLTWLPPDRLDAKAGSVGIPVNGVEIVIRRDDGSDAATGETGEVLARGANVMQCYWKNTAESRKTLLDGWLHTGDTGHLDEDGYLFLEGRKSEMIKSGAHRISAAEIEETILEVPGVNEVAVCGIADELLGQVPVAFVVRELPTLTDKDVLRHCRKLLSLHKVPREVQWRDNLPRTSSGKIQKWKLIDSYVNKDLAQASTE